jgi:hypothetical protein
LDEASAGGSVARVSPWTVSRGSVSARTPDTQDETAAKPDATNSRASSNHWSTIPIFLNIAASISNIGTIDKHYIADLARQVA